MSLYKGKREAPKPEKPEHPVHNRAEREQKPEGPGLGERWRKFYRRHKVGVIVGGSILAVLLLTVSAVGIWWFTNVKAPDIPAITPGGTGDGTHSGTGGGEDETGLGSLVEGIDVNEELPEYISNQKDGVYTFLLIGRTTMDDNSDMLMLIVFDTNTGEINACSIPRDTMINVSSGARKINLAIWSGVEYTKNWVRKTLGVYPNFYVMVDWEGVGEMVEAVGGVYFDVPCRMYYVDSTPGHVFKIDLEEGYQLLNGDQAMQLIRWRHNAKGYEKYATEAGFDGSNTKRTEMQQEFIVAAAKQILQLKNLPYLGSMIQVFTNNVETDLSVGNLAWFAQKALSLDSANKVTFHTLPANYNGSAYCANTKNYQSYVTFQQNALVEMVNTYLNPYESKISLSNLDLMRINSDGTISSSTGSVADTNHNKLINDVNSGLAYFSKNDKGQTVVVYKETDPVTDPGTTDPGTTDPGTTDPGTTDPGTTDPGTTDPGTTDPGTTDPGTTDPGTTDPGTTDPGTTDPGTPTDPGTTNPGTADPGTADPGTADPGTLDPGTTDPGTTDPGTTGDTGTGSAPSITDVDTGAAGSNQPAENGGTTVS